MDGGDRYDPVALWKRATVQPTTSTDGETPFSRIRGSSPLLSPHQTPPPGTCWTSLSQLPPEEQSRFMQRLVTVWPVKSERRAMHYGTMIGPLAGCATAAVVATRINGDLFLMDARTPFFKSMSSCPKLPVLVSCYVSGFTYFILQQMTVAKKIFRQETPCTGCVLTNSVCVALGAGVLLPLVAAPYICYHSFLQMQDASDSKQKKFPPIRHFVTEALTMCWELSKVVRPVLPYLVAFQFAVGTMSAYVLLRARERVFATMDADPDLVEEILHKIHSEPSMKERLLDRLKRLPGLGHFMQSGDESRLSEIGEKLKPRECVPSYGRSSNRDDDSCFFRGYGFHNRLARLRVRRESTDREITRMNSGSARRGETTQCGLTRTSAMDARARRAVAEPKTVASSSLRLHPRLAVFPLVPRSPSSPPAPTRPVDRLVCTICRTRATSVRELATHVRGAHVSHGDQQGMADIADTLMCPEADCDRMLRDVHEVILHLRCEHGLRKFVEREHRFDTIEGFEMWKCTSEKAAHAAFIPLQSASCRDHDNASTSAINVFLHCEHNLQWRTEQTRCPRIACPAYMSVERDESRGKVVVIACTAHAGHPAGSNMPPSKVNGIVQTMICVDCDEVFASRSELSQHRNRLHRRYGARGKMQCADPGCGQRVSRMYDMIDHVSIDHKRDDVVIEDLEFDNFQAFEDWRARMETATASHYKTLGTKLKPLSRPIRRIRYYQCHLSGSHRARIHANEDRDHGDAIAIANTSNTSGKTKKMGRICTAFMNVSICIADGSVRMRGCLTHFGHAQHHVKDLPLPKRTRREVIEMLEEGMEADAIIRVIKSRSSECDRAFYLQRYEVRNLSVKLHHERQRQRIAVARMQCEELRSSTVLQTEMEHFVHDEDREEGQRVIERLLQSPSVYAGNGSTSVDGNRDSRCDAEHPEAIFYEEGEDDEKERREETEESMVLDDDDHAIVVVDDQIEAGDRRSTRKADTVFHRRGLHRKSLAQRRHFPTIDNARNDDDDDEGEMVDRDANTVSGRGLNRIHDAVDANAVAISSTSRNATRALRWLPVDEDDAGRVSKRVPDPVLNADGDQFEQVVEQLKDVIAELNHRSQRLTQRLLFRRDLTTALELLDAIVEFEQRIPAVTVPNRQTLRLKREDGGSRFTGSPLSSSTNGHARHDLSRSPPVVHPGIEGRTAVFLIPQRVSFSSSANCPASSKVESPTYTMALQRGKSATGNARDVSGPAWKSWIVSPCSNNSNNTSIATKRRSQTAMQNCATSDNGESRVKLMKTVNDRVNEGRETGDVRRERRANVDDEFEEVQVTMKMIGDGRQAAESPKRRSARLQKAVEEAEESC